MPRDFIRTVMTPLRPSKWRRGRSSRSLSPNSTRNQVATLSRSWMEMGQILLLSLSVSLSFRACQALATAKAPPSPATQILCTSSSTRTPPDRGLVGDWSGLNGEQKQQRDMNDYIFFYLPTRMPNSSSPHHKNRHMAISR